MIADGDRHIVRLGTKGDGLTADGTAVALAAPGDVVLADGAVRPGPQRAVPPCRHFPRCGGCRLQHVSDTALSDYVADRVMRPLAAAGLASERAHPVHLSPPRTRRRATFAARHDRSGVVLGFREGASHAIVDIKECWLVEPAIFAALAPLRRWLANTLPKSQAAQIQVQVTDHGLDVLLIGPFDAFALAPGLLELADSIDAVRVSIDDGLGAQPALVRGGVTVSPGGVPVELPIGGFQQPTASGEAALIAAVSAAVGDARRVADLFSGIGTFALPLAAVGRSVMAIEGARDAVAALDGAAKARGLPVRAVHRDLFRRPLGPAELEGFDAVVFDPPRAGAAAQSLALAAARVPVVVGVSCNPATFARDAKTLTDGGYRLTDLWPVGQFRWSTHVELVACFARA